MYSTKIALIAILVIMALSFDGKPPQSGTLGMTGDYNVYESPFTLDNGYSFLCVQVSGMKDKKLEQKINSNLTKYFSILSDTWFGEGKTVAEVPIIYLQSSRYLSIRYRFRYITADNLYWNQCVTIDMQSGEVVFLNDLVDLNEGFAELIKHGNIIECGPGGYEITPKELTEQENKYFSSMDTKLILNCFEDFTKNYLYGDYNKKNEPDYDTSGLPYVYRAYFYLREGAICSTPFSGFDSSMIYTIKTKDIKDYLKVPEW